MRSESIQYVSRSRPLVRTIDRMARWHRDVAERRVARRIARQWQFVTDRQLRDLGLDRTALLAGASATAATVACRHE